MAAPLSATPLIALDAFVIDTETTGLDAAKARVVELAAVRLSVGHLSEQGAFRRLVNPGQPIPPETTRVHGIDDAAVADAPSFAQVWPEFTALAGDGVLIGHSIGFDLAVLKRECERIGVAWQPQPSLDIALLAQAVEPNLPGHSLDNLAAWLGVEIVGRHSAVGDAAAAARIFLALLPRLRARGIRTLAEAARVSAELTSVVEGQVRAGWAEPSAMPQRAEPARIDTFAYRHRVGSVMSAPPRTVAPDVTIGAALDIMAREKISSVLIFPSDRPAMPDAVGIVTERDVLRALSTHGADALAMAVSGFGSSPLTTVPASMFAYLAIGRMNRLKIRHLGVTDADGQVAGVLSARDLLRQREGGGIELGDELEWAGNVRELGLAWAKLPNITRRLIDEGLTGREVAAIVSQQLRETTRRACALAERAMQDEGLGDPPRRYSFVVLGSGGRGESLLAMDQDNALVYEGETSEAADAWFAGLGERAADILHQTGVPYCTGGVMAKNSQWRGSFSSWQARVADWIGRSSPHDLLAVDIFFDLCGVFGDVALSERLWRSAFDAAKGQAGFAKLLVEASSSRTAALGWFGGFRTEHGRVDLKRNGLFPIVAAARALAIRHHVVERSTPARLAGIKSLGLGLEADLDALDAAHAVFLDLIASQQIEDIERGLPPGNAVDVKRLGHRDRTRLRTALRAVEPIDAMVRDLLFRT